MLKMNFSSYKYENVYAVDNVMLTFSGIKLTDVLLFILHVSICIETLSITSFPTARFKFLCRVLTCVV